MWKKITGKPGAHKAGLHLASEPPLPKVTADGNELQGYTRPGAKSKDLVRKKQLKPTLGWSGPPYYMDDTVQALGQDQRSKGHRQGRKYHAHRNMLASVG